MRIIKVLVAVAAVLLAVGLAQADTSGPDGHAIIGTSGGHSPSCSSFQSTTSSNGSINGATNGECVVTGAPATTITFAILDANSNGGLTVTSLLTTIGWTETCSSVGGIDQCTLTAPPMPNAGFQPPNDFDCDLGDDLFGIPVGCDINISTASGQPFLPNVEFDASTNGSPLVPFPEPGVAMLLSVGLTGLPFLRRKFVQ